MNCSVEMSAHTSSRDDSEPLPVTVPTDSTAACGTSNSIGRSWPAMGTSGISMAQAPAATVTAVPF